MLSVKDFQVAGGRVLSSAPAAPHPGGGQAPRLAKSSTALHFPGDYEMRFGGSARVADSARPYQYYFRDEAEKTLAEWIEKHNLTSANWHRAIWAGLT